MNKAKYLIISTIIINMNMTVKEVLELDSKYRIKGVSEDLLSYSEVRRQEWSEKVPLLKAYSRVRIIVFYTHRNSMSFKFLKPKP